MFCLPQSTAAAETLVGGQLELGEAAPALALGDLRRELAVGIVEGAFEFGPGGRGTLIGAGRRDPERPRGTGGHGDLVAQLPALALAERAVVAQVRALLRTADVRALRPAVLVRGRAGLACDRCHRGGDQRGVVVLRRVRVRQLALVPEDERAGRDVVLSRVRQVLRRVVLGAAERPRILGHQLGVRIDLDRDRAGGRPRIRHLQSEQRGPVPVRHEVGALKRQPGGGGQVELGVAPPARELGRRTDPLAVDAEPHAVDELERLRPDTAHLAGDVPAVGVEAAVLEADRAGALAGHVVTAVLEAVGDR